VQPLGEFCDDIESVTQIGIVGDRLGFVLHRQS
jgi:hypothetical protein